MTAKPATEHERWQETFSAPEYVFGEGPNAFLERSKPLLPDSGRVLAVSDGEGRNGVWLAEQGLDVVSVDFSEHAQAKARALAEKRGVRIAIEPGDMLAYDWPQAAFDVVVAIFIQYTGPAERQRMFDGMVRCLKPGGLLLLEGYTTRQLAYGTGGPPWVENLYTRDILERELATLSRLEISEYDAEIREGDRHAGISALIDTVGYK